LRFHLLAIMALAFAVLSGYPISSAAADQAQDALQKAIDGPQRTAANKVRDPYRHPLQTLTFFGLRPDMTMVEVWPGGGWYTEILAPYLKDHGKLYVAIPKGGEGADKFKAKLASDPNVYGKVIVTEINPPSKLKLAPDDSADLVLTFRNTHNWISRGYAENMFKAMYRALKPGGTLGIEEHRANLAVAQDPKAASGYVRTDYVVHLVESAGFKLAGESEINANSKDTKDYPKGVWTLPPTLREGDTDRAKYVAIGESDRMTLKFIKPIKLAGKHSAGG
jgi:predicted methyltransferase